MPSFPSIFFVKKGEKINNNPQTVKHWKRVSAENCAIASVNDGLCCQKANFKLTSCHDFSFFITKMLMLRAKPPESWLPKVMANLDAVLVDHAHLERKAATSALSLERYQELFHRVADLNAIAIEELEHFQLVLDILGDRGVSFSHPISSPWISGLMGTIRKGRQEQVIDHLLCAALIEGRSCEKFQLLAGALTQVDAPLGKFYADLVESEGNHYAAYLLMAKEIDEVETNSRLDFYLDLDAELIRQSSDLPILH